MTAPSILEPDALTGIDVGLSVSDSADLGRLGLTPRHAEIAVAEVARAVLIGGGSLTYGGWIDPSGFTGLLMREVERYRTRDDVISFCLAWPQHRGRSIAELAAYDRSFRGAGHVVYLDIDGIPTTLEAGRGEAGEPIDDPAVRRASYTGLRRYMARHTHARVVVGGQLTGFQGAMPGLIEESIMSIEADQPLYVAGGFGGAGAAIVRALRIADMNWLPENMPEHASDPPVSASLERLLGAAGSWSASDNGLDPGDLAALAASHRAGEIASLVATGLARRFNRR